MLIELFMLNPPPLISLLHLRICDGLYRDKLVGITRISSRFSQIELTKYKSFNSLDITHSE